MNAISRRIRWKMLTTPKRCCSSTNTSQIIVEKQGLVTTIGINRPEKRNCINKEVSKLLSQAITDFEEDEFSNAAVLYGTGGNFCSGFDLHELSQLDENKTEIISAGKGPIGIPPRICKKPIVAAISGYAVAGGMELALFCDLRVIEDTAVMGVYNRRFGVPLINGGTIRLQALIGLSRALDLILTGRSIDAKEAFEWGLANRYVACGTALGQAVNLATCLVKFPQECLLHDRKSTYNAAFTESFEKLLKYEQEHGKEIILKESIEGAKKFVSGIGRHGKSYNLTEKQSCHWEK